MEVTMSKADDGLTTSANPTPTRRGIPSGTTRLAGAAVLGYATLHPAEALAAVTHMAPANENKHADLTEARRLVAALNAADDKISAASDAHDSIAEEAAEAERSRLDDQLSDLSAKLAKSPPKTRLDLVTLAEIAGYRMLWKRPCNSWETVRERLSEGMCDDDRALLALTLSVLWLADHREAGNIADLVS
jgi:hypothetical protein